METIDNDLIDDFLSDLQSSNAVIVKSYDTVENVYDAKILRKSLIKYLKEETII